MNFNALPLVTKRLIIINALVFLFTEFLFQARHQFC